MPANPQAPEVVVEVVDRQTYVDFVSHEAKSPPPEYRSAEILSGGSDNHLALRLLAFARHRTQALATVPPGVEVEAMRDVIRSALTRHSDELYWACEYGREFPADVIEDFAQSVLAALRHPAGQGWRDELRAEIINTPETANFMAGVPLEAAHQRERWGSDHDAGKTPFDWFWLIGYLAQKAASAQVAGDTDKAKHHTISTAAALANWHAQLAGLTDMRPGIGPGNGGDKPGSAYDLASKLPSLPADEEPGA